MWQTASRFIDSNTYNIGIAEKILIIGYVKSPTLLRLKKARKTRLLKVCELAFRVEHQLCFFLQASLPIEGSCLSKVTNHLPCLSIKRWKFNARKLVPQEIKKTDRNTCQQPKQYVRPIIHHPAISRKSQAVRMSK